MFDDLATMAEAVIELNAAAVRATLHANALSTAALAAHQHWLAHVWMASLGVDKKKPTTTDSERAIMPDSRGGKPMYTLSKAKEEIDAIAKHALEIAGHALALNDQFDAKLASFKADILTAIDAKFADLEKTVMGDLHAVESSTLEDLGAKVALLKQGAAPPAAPEAGGGHAEHHEGHQ